MTSTTAARLPVLPRTLLHTVAPAVAGVIVALVVGAEGGVPSIVMVCAAIYLTAAVVARPWAAWVAFAASGPFMAIGVVSGNVWLSLLAIGLAQVILLAVGIARGTWARPEARLQIVGAVAFSALAVIAAAGAPVVAGIVVVVGLVGHGVWDVVHHVRERVVARSYSAFCAALDFALAAVIVLALILT